MSANRIYLDDNASAPLRAAARDAAANALDAGNPSSVYAEGRDARRIVNEAREAVATLSGAKTSDIVFTSGASEANAIVLGGLKLGGKAATHLLVSAIEHPSVLWGGRFGADARATIPVGKDGRIAPQAVATMLGALPGGAVPLVSVMAANNETGVIQPVAEIAEVVHAAGGVLHCDAVQAAGRLDLAKVTADADLVSLSGHKMGAPKGVGALVIRNADVTFAAPHIGGGGQERNRRAGTENVPGIAGFGASAREACDESARWAEIQGLREWIEGRLCTISPTTCILGGDQPRLPNTICVALDGVQAETAVIAFDLAGISISAGSACSSGKVGPSHVLEAMGLDSGLKKAALRVSLTRDTTREEAEAFVAAWEKICAPAGARRSAA
ncbi:cysteine desulfurase family protein [Tepidamorphus sp. 3E244]|uniref:cysteine desulfurase family protein n=1 Tax=Tepidamorphus sp. 3E244 TaxID=3385498 RepID=UPI0038FD1EC7